MRKVQSNPLNCPLTRTIGFIGGKWKPIILGLLIEGPLRFGKLTVFLPTISRKMLSQELGDLEKDGLVLRHSYMEKPPRVEYELSAKGKSMVPILNAMLEWGKAEAGGNLEPAEAMSGKREMTVL
jgi:DNA-binding HxlR family transcriptional regulator